MPRSSAVNPDMFKNDVFIPHLLFHSRIMTTAEGFGGNKSTIVSQLFLDSISPLSNMNNGQITRMNISVAVDGINVFLSSRDYLHIPDFADEDSQRCTFRAFT